MKYIVVYYIFSLMFSLNELCGEPTLRCGACHKMFYTKDGMRTHHLAHTSVEPVSCKMCGKAFKYMETLKEHIKVHTGIKYGCKLCGKMFSYRSSLSRHLSTFKH